MTALDTVILKIAFFTSSQIYSSIHIQYYVISPTEALPHEKGLFEFN